MNEGIPNREESVDIRRRPKLPDDVVDFTEELRLKLEAWARGDFKPITFSVPKESQAGGDLSDLLDPVTDGGRHMSFHQHRMSRHGRR